MADDATGTAQKTSEGDGKNTEQKTGSGTAEAQNNGDTKTFTQAELDRIVKERLADERKRAERTAEESRLKEQGEYKALAEQKDAELQTLKAQIAQRDHDLLRTRIAQKHSLPAELADRLAGTTEAELEADAANLAKLVKPVTHGGTGGGADGGAGRNGGATKPEVTPGLGRLVQAYQTKANTGAQ